MEAYANDPDGLEALKKSNLETYGNENGGTPEYFYKKYGSWETVIEKAFSTNAGADACLGLYDKYYYTYIIDDNEDETETTTETTTEKQTETTAQTTVTQSNDSTTGKVNNSSYSPDTGIGINSTACIILPALALVVAFDKKKYR